MSASRTLFEEVLYQNVKFTHPTAHIIDVGAHPHGRMLRQNVHKMSPKAIPTDYFRTAPSEGCICLARDCTHIPSDSVGVSVHSAYYLKPDDYHNLFERGMKALYILYHPQNSRKITYFNEY